MRRLVMKKVWPTRIATLRSYSKTSNDLDDALAYARKSLNIRTKIRDSLNIGRSYANIGIFISQKGDHDSGIYYNNLALPYFQSVGNSYGISLCLHNMGTDFHLLNATDSALVCSTSAKSELIGVMI